MMRWDDDLMNKYLNQTMMQGVRARLDTKGEREKRKTGCIPLPSAKEADRVGNMADNHGRW